VSQVVLLGGVTVIVKTRLRCLTMQFGANRSLPANWEKAG
jgi:hypothetical protein